MRPGRQGVGDGGMDAAVAGNILRHHHLWHPRPARHTDQPADPLEQNGRLGLGQLVEKSRLDVDYYQYGIIDVDEQTDRA